jgi:hypothetical protein
MKTTELEDAFYKNGQFLGVYIKLQIENTDCYQGTISPMVYEQLLRVKIPKAQKIQSSCCQSFLCFWDLRA